MFFFLWWKRNSPPALSLLVQAISPWYFHFESVNVSYVILCFMEETHIGRSLVVTFRNSLFQLLATLRKTQVQPLNADAGILESCDMEWCRQACTVHCIFMIYFMPCCSQLQRLNFIKQQEQCYKNKTEQFAVIPEVAKSTVVQYSTLVGHHQCQVLTFKYFASLSSSPSLWFSQTSLIESALNSASLEFKPVNLTTTLWPGSLFHKDTHSSYMLLTMCVCSRFTVSKFNLTKGQKQTSHNL